MTAKRLLVARDEFLVALEIKAILSEAGYEAVGPAAAAKKAPA